VVGAWEGTPGAVEVAYDGVGLGDAEGTLTLTSDGGAVFTVPLRAKTVPPVAVGPLSLAAGGSVDFVFKNPFLEDKEFLLATDNPSVFSTTPLAGVVKIGKKGELKVTVKSTPGSAEANPPVGRVTLRLAHANKVGGGGKADGAQWVWYLQVKK